MTVQKRPTPIHPSVFNVADLDHALAKMAESQLDACFESEVIQSIGHDAHKAAETRYSTYTTIRELIAAWLSEEAEDKVREAAEEQWQRLRDADLSEPDLRLMSGDR